MRLMRGIACLVAVCALLAACSDAIPAAAEQTPTAEPTSTATPPAVASAQPAEPTGQATPADAEEEREYPYWDGDTLVDKVNLDEVFTFNCAYIPPWFLFYKDMRMEPTDHVVEKTQTYQQWMRSHISFYPDFEGRISYEGEEKICRYYRDMAEDERANMQGVPLFEEDEIVMDAASMRLWYSIQIYDERFADPYLSVRHVNSMYAGGAHDLHGYAIDNFDMRTGKLLTLKDVLGEPDAYASDINRLLHRYLEPQQDALFEYDPKAQSREYLAEDPEFRICEDGLLFLFPEYAIGPYAAGAIEVTLPYEELSDLLKIDPPRKVE